MQDIQYWLTDYTAIVKKIFGSRIVFIGLQGSYAREEANPSSDIDPVLILDQLNFHDLKNYRTALNDLPEREKICGFIAGKEELLHWNRSDLFQFYHDTKPLFGSLEFLSEKISREDVRQAIILGAGNIYHGCAHNVVHENDRIILDALLKNVFFVLQAKCFYETGVYYQKRSELFSHLSPLDLEVAPLRDRLQEWNSKETKQETEQLLFDEISEKLLFWSQTLLKNNL